MADKTNQESSDEFSNVIPVTSVDNQNESLHQTRRRLIKVGLLAVPIILTVRSRPVFAQSGSVGLGDYIPYQDPAENEGNGGNGKSRNNKK
jgi:hypothetical protein